MPTRRPSTASARPTSPTSRPSTTSPRSSSPSSTAPSWSPTMPASTSRFINAELARLGQPPVDSGPRRRHAGDRPAQASDGAEFARRALPPLRHRQQPPHQARRAARFGAAGRSLYRADRRQAGALGLEIVQEPRPGSSESIIVDGGDRRAAAPAGAAALRGRASRARRAGRRTRRRGRSGDGSAETQSPAAGRADRAEAADVVS